MSVEAATRCLVRTSDRAYVGSAKRQPIGVPGAEAGI
jgi:hypothetical protein